MLDLDYLIGHVYYLSEIYHSGYSGPEYTRKKGEKYDQRRHHYCTLRPVLSMMGYSFIIYQYDDEELDTPSQYTVTTPYMDSFEEEGYVYLRTANSIYQLKKIRRRDLD